MSRRRGASNVRGPNSALTEFLRVEGITENFRRRRERETEQQIADLTQDSSDDVNESSTTADNTEVEASTSGSRSTIRDIEEDEDVQQIRLAARRKRRAAGEQISDDEDDGNNVGDSDDEDYVVGNEYKIEGEEDTCIECHQPFKLSVYSRYDKLRKGYLCEDCNELIKAEERKKRKNQMSAKRRRKRVAQALLDKSFVKIPSLQDVCIKVITSNIDQVETLGDIGTSNLNEISKILSKNRSLDNSTMALFLNPNMTKIEFWDCSNVDSDSFNKIASFCPNLTSLTLFMCGQFHNDNLVYFSDKLNLNELNLNGPFLISDVMWQEFFENGGKNLENFEIRNTHRFGNDSLISLLENCGSSLKSLKLSRLDGIDSAAMYELIPHYLTQNCLETLEISYPKSEELVTNELIINVLSMCEGSLSSLNLDGCSDLTDLFTQEMVKFNLDKLTSLSLKNLDQIKDFDFTNFKNNGLISLNLYKCVELSEASVYSILKHSCSTLVELCLNSVPVSKNFWWQIFTPNNDELKKRYLKSDSDDESENDDEDDDESPKAFYDELSFPNLTSLDLGFVRSVDDQVLNLISKKCPKLKVLEVFGDNRCTFGAKVREDLIIIGRQGDLN